MYIMINNIKGEKTIDLSYPIHSKNVWGVGAALAWLWPGG